MATTQALRALRDYNRMRDFAQSPEPAGEVGAAKKSIGKQSVVKPSNDKLSFVVQKHAARSLHYDFRLELDGTLKSWAIPKGPSLDPADKRMAVQVEDHPLSYANFEGVIPPKHYGAGTVIVWDRGSWAPEGDVRKGLRDGKLRFALSGEKLHGRWAMVRMRPRDGEHQPAWLLMKERDEFARDHDEFDVVAAEPDSVLKKRGAAKAITTKAMATRSTTTKAKRAAKSAPTVAAKPAMRITHPDRVIDPQSGVTKGELVAYYAQVAPLMLPHLKDRPIALVRAPGGVAGPQFFQKHAQADELPGTVSLDPSLDAPNDALLVIASAQGLQSSAQMNAVEFHTWNMTSRTMPRADRMLFDLDPGEGVQWPAVREAAQLLHAFLDQIGLASFVKTSGGKGLHVVVPLTPRHDWNVVAPFSHAVVTRMAEVVPQRFVAKSGPRNRVGKIFIDYLRNNWGATTASAWSARARPGLGVSVPIDWRELDDIDSGAHWSVRDIEARLARGNDPWAAYASTKQTLTKAMKAMDFEAEDVAAEAPTAAASTPPKATRRTAEKAAAKTAAKAAAPAAASKKPAKAKR